MEGRSGLLYGINRLQCSVKRLAVRERAVARRMQMRKVEHGTDPAGSPRDLEHVVERAEVAHAAHHLDAERDGAILTPESLAQLSQLLDDGVERVLARTAEQEARMEDDDLGVAGLRDARRVVEHAHRHVELDR